MLPSKKFLFIINPKSGAGNINWQQEIEQYLHDKDITFSFFSLPQKCTNNTIYTAIADSSCTHAIAVGGDGTVALVAKAIIHTQIVLGILPAGSANGMARELNIPEKPAEALKILTEGHDRICDAVLINEDHLCVHLSDIGMNARLIKYFDEGELRGKWGYAKVILRTLWKNTPMNVAIITPDESILTKAVMVVIANASKYGTGAVINPEGKLTDGLFEVVIVHRLSIKALLRMLLKPGPFDPKHVEIYSCTRVNIKTGHHVHFQVDGEYLGRTKNITARILSSSIRILLPTL